jgi:hypothetical protein
MQDVHYFSGITDPPSTGLIGYAKLSTQNNIFFFFMTIKYL